MLTARPSRLSPAVPLMATMEDPQSIRTLPPLTMPTALPWPPETAPATWPSAVSSRVIT